MIRHIVIIYFRKDAYADYLSLMEKTKPLINSIPGIISYKIFQNTSKYVPKDINSIGVEIIFKDKDALDLFMTNPKHYEANALFERYMAEPPYMVLTHEL
jgi:quinol monooxygenase YgiN